MWTTLSSDIHQAKGISSSFSQDVVYRVQIWHGCMVLCVSRSLFTRLDKRMLLIRMLNQRAVTYQSDTAYRYEELSIYRQIFLDIWANNQYLTVSETHILLRLRGHVNSDCSVEGCCEVQSSQSLQILRYGIEGIIDDSVSTETMMWICHPRSKVKLRSQKCQMRKYPMTCRILSHAICPRIFLSVDKGFNVITFLTIYL